MSKKLKIADVDLYPAPSSTPLLTADELARFDALFAIPLTTVSSSPPTFAGSGIAPKTIPAGYHLTLTNDCPRFKGLALIVTKPIGVTAEKDCKFADDRWSHLATMWRGLPLSTRNEIMKIAYAEHE